MKIGVLKERKVEEYRVVLLPLQVAQLVDAGHQVFVENDAGSGVGIPDSIAKVGSGGMVHFPKCDHVVFFG